MKITVPLEFNAIIFREGSSLWLIALSWMSLVAAMMWMRHDGISRPLCGCLWTKLKNSERFKTCSASWESRRHYPVRMPEDFPYALTFHAAKAISEREIPNEWIARGLMHPLKTEPDRNDPELRHALASIAEYGNRVLRVIYNHATSPLLIVVSISTERKEATYESTF
jgi:hypothetical protein